MLTMYWNCSGALLTWWCTTRDINRRSNVKDIALAPQVPSFEKTHIFSVEKHKKVRGVYELHGINEVGKRGAINWNYLGNCHYIHFGGTCAGFLSFQTVLLFFSMKSWTRRAIHELQLSWQIFLTCWDQQILRVEIHGCIRWLLSPHRHHRLCKWNPRLLRLFLQYFAPHSILGTGLHPLLPGLPQKLKV